ncbi:MAG: polyamine aminopropyltransferase [Nitrosospira sp.]
MRAFSRRRFRGAGNGTDDNSGDDSGVHMSEEYGVRSLHIGSSMVQSAMRLATPNHLELTYTRCMMGFALFHPRPENVLMIGLGGGSLAKFVYHRLPQVQTTVIEINPQIVAMAREHFFVPADDDRLQVVIAEGGEFVASHPDSADIIMVDGFDDGRQVPSLCSQGFYDHALEALNSNGVLVVNLLSRDRAVHDYLHRIEDSFGGRVATLLAEPFGNLIVFAFEQSLGKAAWERENLQERAKQLEQELALPFTRFVKKLQQRSPF